MLEVVLVAENDPIECDLVAMMKAHLVTQIAEVNRKLQSYAPLDRACRADAGPIST